MCPLLTGQYQDGVTGEFKAEQITRSEFNTAALFFASTCHDSKPAGFFTGELAVRTTGFVTV